MRVSRQIHRLLLLVVVLALAAGACTPGGPSAASTPSAEGEPPTVLATATFLADIAQNVAGSRLKVASLIPRGVDPHDFEPTPRDVALVSDSQVLIANGAGLEEFLRPLLDNVGGERVVIEASQGLAPRATVDEEHAAEGDPHFWLDPLNVVTYVENIRDGLSAADPAGRDTYAANAAAYVAQLQELDGWIREQVERVPPEDRLLITNHESFGYYADRYGFEVVGTIIPSVSTESAPSARQMADLIDTIRATGAKAIFLETGANEQLAQQVAAEAGIQKIAWLLTHSLTEEGGEAPTYLDMIRYNTTTIVEALSTP